MSVQTSTPFAWSSPDTTNKYTPLKRIDDERQPHIVNQVQRMLLIDDDEIYEEEEEDFSDLPPTSQKSTSDSDYSDNEHAQYINSIRKTRPLPQIPQRSTSKELPKNMTEVFNDSFKNQNKLTAQQLFRMMCENRDNQAYNNSDEESTPNESDDSDDDYYDGVYAIKTQIPSPEISKRNSSIIHSSYHYDHFNSHAYKMMTPVEEVEEEDQLFADYALEIHDEEEEEVEEPNYLLDPMEHVSPRSRPMSEVSFVAPSFTSTSSQSVNDVKINTGEENHNMTSEEECQSQQDLEQIQPQQKLNQRCYTPLYNTDYINGKESKLDTNSQAQVSSLVSDVQRLSELNQALMTPVLSKSTMTSSPFEASLQQSSNNDYSSVNCSSQTMTSFSLTHDKESIKTYRRMATKTHDKNIQFTYAKYLLQLVSSYNTNTIISRNSDNTRDRLQEEAEYWIEKLAKGNHAEALYIKGQWHRHCFGNSMFVGTQYKKVNHNKAVKCFQQAAKLGFTEAHYEMAEYYKFRKEYKKAISSYRYAALNNHILSLYNLANILLRGLLGQEKDIQQGMIFLKKAADLNKPESARSAYDLACIYSNDFESIGIDRSTITSLSLFNLSHELALEYFKKADELDLTAATFRLGRIYNHGLIGAKANAWEAFKCYYKAAEKRHEGAMLELSKLYKEGIAGYLNPHPIMAYEWCKRATESDNEVAQFIMGNYYEQGVGVQPDHKQALIWYNKSALKGYGPAQEKLNISNDKKVSMISSSPEPKNQNHSEKTYFEESVRIAEKSRRTRAEQNCQIM